MQLFSEACKLESCSDLGMNTQNKNGWCNYKMTKMLDTNTNCKFRDKDKEC